MLTNRYALARVRKTALVGLALAVTGAMLPVLAPAASADDQPSPLVRRATHAGTSGPDALTAAPSKRVIVKYKRSVKASARAKSLGAKGLRSRETLGLVDAQVVDVPSGRTAAEVVSELSKDPQVVYAVPDVVRRPLADAPAPNDTWFGQQWGMRNLGKALDPSSGSPTTPLAGVDVDALGAWGVTKGSPDVTVAVIDEGVALDHPDLSAALWTNPGEVPGNGLDDDGNGYVDDVHGWDFVRNSPEVDTPLDADEHGTHVAGIIGATAGNGRGVAGLATGVKLMSLKFMTEDGGSDSDAIKAIQYAKDKGAKVINASWGASSADAGGAPVDNPLLRDAIASCGCVFIAASGNSGASGNVAANRNYPAAFNLPNEVSVAAAGMRGGLAGFSNRGWTVDLAAPGDTILSTLPASACDDGNGGTTADCYGWWSGTSMAAPFVSATAALMLSKDPTLTPEDVVSTIKATVQLAGKMDVTTGGMVDAGAALRQVASKAPVAHRLGGRDRYTVAATVAGEFEPGVAVAYVASGEGFADALAGAALAASQKAPMLLTSAGSVPVPTAEALTRLQPAKIVVLGGPGSVSSTVMQRLAAYATTGSVTRIQGDATYGTDRYGTAAKIALRLAALTGDVNTVYLASGQNFPDALAGAALAGSQGQPVLLTTSSRLPVGTSRALGVMKPTKIVILGGPASVSDGIKSELARSYVVERIGGADRYDVAANVASRMGDATSAYVANGSGFSDALAGASVAGSAKAPIILVQKGAVPTSAASALDKLTLSSIVTLGGVGSVTPANVLSMSNRFVP
ncbi:MAG TPA: S8 family serine peptidase [Actinomycetales bacterium]|nr:S8 family serine peptidase [Actinomycetales bacterium]